MSVFSSEHFDHHEHVAFCSDRDSGLRAIIAVHNTNRGPSLGGCRMWPYDSEDEAVADVLRLSRGMTYKSAIANLPLGGGKSVIIGDPQTDKTPQLFAAMGRFVDSLGGRYIAAEDVGISVADIDIIRSQTRYAAGTSEGSGNPSPSTAQGVFVGLRAAVAFKLHRGSLDGLKVAVNNFHLDINKAGGTNLGVDVDPNDVIDFSITPLDVSTGPDPADIITLNFDATEGSLLQAAGQLVD